jgi:GT2 family glycosyltransferase
MSGHVIDMSPEVSLVLVTHHSSGVIEGAVASFRAEVGRTGVRGEVVLVDHSEDAEECARLEKVAPDRLHVQANLGYAAGVNAGVAQARGAILVVGNPDVRFIAGSLGGLLAALASGWDVAGPQFVLGDLLFAPADVQTPGEELRRWLASRSRPLWRLHFRRELRRWRKAWEASAPLAVPALSGALLAFRHEVAEKVGPWDEGYFLYFEETEWLRRAAADGMRLALVPSARVEHLWGHAANPVAYSDRAGASRSRFLASEFGWRGRLVDRLRPTRTPLRPRAFPADLAELPQKSLLWLLSPTSLGLPAAGLHGPASSFAQSLRFVMASREAQARYLVLAAEPATGEIEGVWYVERGND